MAYTGINSEDRLVQEPFAEHLENELNWDSEYAWKKETFGPNGTLGRKDKQEVVLTRDLRSALKRLNPKLPPEAIDDAISKMTRHDVSRSLIQHNQEFYRYIRDGVPVSYLNEKKQKIHDKAKVIDFNIPSNNRFLAVRELEVTGLRAPNYNRRIDLICFVNGLPVVVIELKAVHKNIRAGFDGNLRDYLNENSIVHAFHHNAFVVVSNGDSAKYGSITSPWEHFSDWKRNDEKDKGSLDAEVLLNGMFDHERLLDIIENFILFDSSKAGSTRKIVARNHQVMGVNLAVASVWKQEQLKEQFPPEERLQYRVVEMQKKDLIDADMLEISEEIDDQKGKNVLEIVESAHPDLGKLGVFWHTQGSGKSYSMIFFTEKVRRKISAKFTFLLMTDRKDLDSQIYRTFIGCGAATKQTPRAGSGDDLKMYLEQNHRYIFSLIHKFNKDVDPFHPYSKRDDIIVISDEAHRTQAGKLARNMRLALPNASFIGFTGTPLFKHDQLTKRIFGGYVSRYDFKRSEEDGSTVKLVYESRGEKLGISRPDLNDRIANAVAKASLDPDKQAHLEKLLGKDYEIITADDRLDKIAVDFVEHCSTRWESGKAMLVCIDKVTCARMYQRIIPLWEAKIAKVKADISQTQTELSAESDEEKFAEISKKLEWLKGQADWMEETLIQIIISEEQNEVSEFQKWKFDIIPHRTLMKQGFEVGDKRVDVESAFKDPKHPFRVAIVCAMWLTGFDVESLSTLYIDKSMKAHTLMQAIARANRRYPGKDFGLIVDYNGMLKSLRAALALYALGDGEDSSGEEEIVAPIEERLQALIEAIDETENHLRSLGFEPDDLHTAKNFEKIRLFRDAVTKLYTNDESKRRFEILARQVFIRFKSLIMEKSVYKYAIQHDNIEAIYKKLQERRDNSDVTDLIKELHKIVNEAISTQSPGTDSNESITFDLSKIDLEKLRDEFAKKVTHKTLVIKDIRDLVEEKLALMLKQNPQRMDYYKKYSEIIADYNNEKDRVTIEDTFARLIELVNSLDNEAHRAINEGLSEEELAIFDLLKKDKLSSKELETIKQASKDLLASIHEHIDPLQGWTAKEQTQAEVEVLVLDKLYELLPTPPFTEEEKNEVAVHVYQHIWEQSVASTPPVAA
ncbi:type I restriction endonuclease subunit R [Methanococcoides methylutens]|uniref:type I site-specific deoxyribonuclease n=1 Tax=Methanococcoides methylutens MM1 TaxID=1434104 RepID=A0A0E3SPJ9_METMT|nr:type I restriction endonuclease subunit R [Methanococcoides methylutens]AKB84506.1 Type I restriction-modification system, restriction subunit R [Methanococcoides methylutens MM1]